MLWLGLGSPWHQGLPSDETHLRLLAPDLPSHSLKERFACMFLFLQGDRLLLPGGSTAQAAQVQEPSSDQSCGPKLCLWDNGLQMWWHRGARLTPLLPSYQSLKRNKVQHAAPSSAGWFSKVKLFSQTCHATVRGGGVVTGAEPHVSAGVMRHSELCLLSWLCMQRESFSS